MSILYDIESHIIFIEDHLKNIKELLETIGGKNERRDGTQKA